MIKQIAQLELNIQEKAAEHELPGSEYTDPNEGMTNLIAGFMSAAMTLGALLLLGYLLMGAMEWLNSGGDSSKIEKAKQKMTAAVVGIAILSAITAIFMVIQEFLGINVLNFGTVGGGGV